MKNIRTKTAIVQSPVIDLAGDKDKRRATRDTADTDSGDCPEWYKVD